MDSQLKSIISAVDSISDGLDKQKSVPKEAIEGSAEGISLLSLKNHAMLSYLQNIALIAASQIARSQKDTKEVMDKAVKGSITQRVVLEKGVKGLEAKIAYQIEKVLRANFKAKQDAELQASGEAEAAQNGEESDSDDDTLNYKPNPNALVSSTTGIKRPSREEEEASAKPTKYEVPKIAPVSLEAKDRDAKASRRRKNATMEEYLRQTSVAPVAEPSIGSTIMDHGRGGERTERDSKKQAEIDRYEENNFTRIVTTSKKQERKAARQRQRDAYGKNFFGEDWGFTTNKSDDIAAATKRRKGASVWERTKKRQRRD
ncbi:U3 small nucleolar ribonucleoprotein protein Lcp5p [Trichomonascus vanleenenianus]|uniref:small subunit rRNA maturation protein LCP5 n=1 Tax=Trichomonascus vanleenenianus TaxID=2268995 RepID=UPI003ECB6AF7